MGAPGFVGFLLFISIGFVAAFTGTAVIRRARGNPEFRWAGDLAAMLQVGLAAYATAGAFLNLAYFDMFYHYAAIMAATSLVLKREAAARREEQAPPQGGVVGIGGAAPATLRS